MKKQRSNSTSSNDPNASSVAPQLPRTLERRLASYALAVGAAGAGLLSLAPAAKADIIYTPSSLSIYAGYPFETFYFPIQWNGQTRLSFSAGSGYGAECRVGPCVHWRAIGVKAASGTGVNTGPLAFGSQIGPQTGFGAGQSRLDSFAYGSRWTGSGGISFFTPSQGSWARNRSGYLGLQFLVNGQDYYGWVALSVNQGTGEVTGYAYETNPNESIGAGQISEGPEPGTLGLLALGSLGLGYWRRKKQAVENSEQRAGAKFETRFQEG